MSSFTLAGESLGVPKSTVSEHVQALEALLGTRLLQRTTRRVQATQDGLVLYERSRDLMSHMDEIEGLFRQDAASLTGRIRFDMPNFLGQQMVMPRLPEFMALHPTWNWKSAPLIAGLICRGKALIAWCGSVRSRINQWSRVTCVILR